MSLTTVFNHVVIGLVVTAAGLTLTDRVRVEFNGDMDKAEACEAHMHVRACTAEEKQATQRVENAKDGVKNAAITSGLALLVLPIGGRKRKQPKRDQV